MSFTELREFKFNIAPFYKADVELEPDYRIKYLKELYAFLLKHTKLNSNKIIVNKNDTISNILYLLGTLILEETDIIVFQQSDTNLIYPHDSLLLAANPEIYFKHGYRLQLINFSRLDKTPDLQKVLLSLLNRIMQYVPPYAGMYDNQREDLFYRLDDYDEHEDKDEYENLVEAMHINDDLDALLLQIKNHKYIHTDKHIYRIANKYPKWEQFILDALDFLASPFHLFKLESIAMLDDDNEEVAPFNLIGWCWTKESALDQEIWSMLEMNVNEYGVADPHFIYDINNFDKDDFESKKKNFNNLINFFNNEYSCLEP